MTSVVSVGDLQTERARATRAAWMEVFDVGRPPAPHPAPIVPARPPRPDDHLTGPFGAVLLGALAAGWLASAFYSRGTKMAATGKPGRLTEVVSLRCWRFPNQRAALTWERPDGGEWGAGDGWAWEVGQRPVAYGVEQTKVWMIKGITPVRTEDKPPADKGACQVCAALISLNKNGTLRVHGPKTDRCVGGKRPPLAA
jgi:hypothetical protein